MAGVVHIPWYATMLRNERIGEALAEITPLSLRFGATKYQVHQSCDDRYKFVQMIWFESKEDWYRFWESPALNEFRARHAGHYQIPLVYVWHDELAAGELGPAVENENGVNGHAPKPTPKLEPHAA